MAEIGMAVLEQLRAAVEGLEHPVGHQHSADGGEPAAEPLAMVMRSGRDAFLLAGVQRAVRPMPHTTRRG